mmetsp:Transcript_45388/g.95251  ORF Transcript_45388/g.95251 Transcript_45388/m.95251 type:complete len:202 (-) Transcript_45388:836-1441(-)
MPSLKHHLPNPIPPNHHSIHPHPHYYRALPTKAWVPSPPPPRPSPPHPTERPPPFPPPPPTWRGTTPPTSQRPPAPPWRFGVPSTTPPISPWIPPPPSWRVRTFPSFRGGIVRALPFSWIVAPWPARAGRPFSRTVPAGFRVATSDLGSAVDTARALLLLLLACRRRCCRYSTQKKRAAAKAAHFVTFAPSIPCPNFPFLA